MSGPAQAPFIERNSFALAWQAADGAPGPTRGHASRQSAVTPSARSRNATTNAAAATRISMADTATSVKRWSRKVRRAWTSSDRTVRTIRSRIDPLVGGVHEEP